MDTIDVRYAASMRLLARMTARFGWAGASRWDVDAVSERWSGRCTPVHAIERLSRPWMGIVVPQT